MQPNVGFIKRATVLLLLTYFPVNSLTKSGILHTPFISNLNILVNIFERNVCFILLDNYLNIDIPPFNFPTVVRHLDKIYCKKNTSKIFYSSNEDLIKNRKTYPKFCARLDLFRLSMHIKPWNCQAHIQIYPKLKLFDLKSIIYPQIFNYKISINSRLWEFMEPSALQLVNILILEKSSIKSVGLAKRWSKQPRLIRNRDWELVAFHHWIHNYVICDKHGPSVHTNVFIVAYTTLIANTSEFKLTSFFTC